MFKKVILAILFLCFEFGFAAKNPPKHLYLSVSLHESAVISEDEYVKYGIAKLLFDSYLNYNHFKAKECFYQSGNVDNVYVPLDLLIGHRSDYFYEIFGDIGECPCDIFSREIRPFRRILEEKLIFNFQESSLTKNDCIVYTSVGSGGLFQDLVIITKLLEEGCRKFVINLIDTRYEKFMEKAFGQGLIKDIFHVEKIGNVHGREDFDNDIIYDFLRWFNFLSICCYEGLAVDVRIYDGLKAYLTDCKKGSNKKSDVGVIIDFDGSLGAPKNIDFDSLSKRYLNPFYLKFFKKGIEYGGVYGFAVMGNLQGSLLEKMTGGAIFNEIVPTRVAWHKDSNVPVFGFCGIKGDLS